MYMYLPKIQAFLADLTEILIGTNMYVTIQYSIYLYWSVQLKRAFYTSTTSYIKIAFLAAACWADRAWIKLYQWWKGV